MHSRNFKNYSSCTKCSVCHEPEPQCSCSHHHTDKTVPVTITQFDCAKKGGYLKGECVEFNGSYYISNIDGNDVEPSHGVKFSPPIWSGGYSLCELISAKSIGKEGAQGPQGLQGDRGGQGDIGPQGTKGDIGVQGVQGPQGYTGNDGPQGVNGEKGDRGEQGTRGNDGAQGVDGGQGIQGAQGAGGVPGSQGVDGAQGVAGSQGVDGEPGLQGAQGVAGRDGTQGPQGVQGLPYEPNIISPTPIDPLTFTCPAGNGVTSILDAVNGLIYFCVDGVLQPNPKPFGEGPQGAQGSQGVAGRDGSQGAQGQRGLQGNDGAQGVQGQRGLQGEKGPQGEVGVNGVQGQRGVQGVEGSQGLQGSQGAQGVRGAQGVKGEQGIEGTKGNTGSQGPIGTQGADGVQGVKGEKGDTGAQGPQGEFGGPQGPQGAQGLQGTQGAQGAAGKDYDPNCIPPIVDNIACANAKGNIAFYFTNEEIKYFSYKDFIPTQVALTNYKFNDEGKKVTENPNGSTITWFSVPIMSVIVTDFEPVGFYDKNHQIITYKVIDRNTGGCIGKGEWIILVECDDCPCVVPDFIQNSDGSITIKDNKGLIFTVWPKGKDNCYTPQTTACPSSSLHPAESLPQTTDECNVNMEGSFLKVTKWDKCTTGFDVGIIEYNGLLYINLVKGNTDIPAVGVANGSYLGGYDLYALINKMITLQVESKVKTMIDKRLVELGLIKV